MAVQRWAYLHRTPAGGLPRGWSGRLAARVGCPAPHAGGPAPHAGTPAWYEWLRRGETAMTRFQQPIDHHAATRPRRAMPRTAPRRTVQVAVAALAAVLLTACGGSSDNASPAGTTAESPATAAPPGAAALTDPAVPTPSAAFFAGIDSTWTVPGTAIQDTVGSVSADRTMIGMWADGDGGTLRVFALTAAESAPLWEGQCATARWWANRLVCGTDIVDPATGETAPLPAGAYAGSNAETLVLRDGDTWVAYGTDLAELWRSEIAGDGMLYGFADLPVAMAVDMSVLEFHTVDLRTGESTPTAMTVLAVDGYLEVASGATRAVAHDFAGTQLWERPVAAPECIPPFGERQVLADRAECPARYEGAVEINGLNVVLLRAASPRVLELAAAGFTVDGETFDAGDRGLIMAWMFGDEDHFLARFDSGFGLYRAGSAEPVWELAANDLLVTAPEVLLAYGDGGTVTVLTPAG